MPRLRGLRTGALVATMAVVLVLTPGTAGAAGSVYPSWTLVGAAPDQSGTMSLPATGFPRASFTSTSNTVTNPSGASAFLGPGTPFGAVFGSSQGERYLNVPAAPGGVPSTLTFTFARPTPASGWGFALGDIDADAVTVEASGPGGPLAVAQLGFQGVFNYCASSPVPSTCAGPPFTDVPTWGPLTSTLVGNVLDTSGASGWFRPTVPVTSLTFTFTAQSGIPLYQLWFAALTSDIGGRVTASGPAGPGGGAVPVPAGSVLQLQDAGGSPVLDTAGDPVTASAAPDGSYAFAAVTATAYAVAVVAPSGFGVVGPALVGADATAGDVTGADFALQAAAAPPGPAPPAPAPAPPGPPPGGDGTVATLPVTGSGPLLLALAGVGLTAVGLALDRVSRRPAARPPLLPPDMGS